MPQDSPETGSMPVPHSSSRRPANECLEIFHENQATEAPHSNAEGAAVLGTGTALAKPPKDGTERLKPYRWTKGRSGNPGGRPKRLPVTDALRALLEKPLPDTIRAGLEKAMGARLPRSLTMAEGLALDTLLAAFGKRSEDDSSRRAIRSPGPKFRYALRGLCPLTLPPGCH